MAIQELAQKLNDDLANEYTHMLFYLHHSAMVSGPHRPEYRRFLSEQAASEMEHVREFSDLILSMNVIPTVSPKPFETSTDPVRIIQLAADLEREVLKNYLERMKEADELGGIHGTAVRLFLEEQFEHSHEDLTDMLRMLRTK